MLGHTPQQLAMVRQVIADAVTQSERDGFDRIPMIAWRRNQQGINRGVPWMGALPLLHIFQILGGPAVLDA